MQKWLAGRKMATKFLLKMGFWYPKNSKDGRLDDLRLFEYQDLKEFTKWDSG